MMATPVLRTIFAPKEGNTEAEYEDAWASSPLNAPIFTVALADGASSAGFARDWAQRLTRTFAAANNFPESDSEAAAIITALGADWRVLATEKATSWHAQEKLDNGSAATLLVVTFDTTKKTWKAAAIGDVCVFLIRKGKLRYAFPLTRAAKFDDRPALLSTEIGSRAAMPPVLRYAERYEDGDRFLLMTDALAHWFLKDYEGKRRPWETLPETDALLPGWLKLRRDKNHIKNDDVTLIDLTL